MKTLFVSPIGRIKNLYPISFAIVKVLKAKGLKVGYVKPIGHTLKNTTLLYKEVFNEEIQVPLTSREVEKLILNDRYDFILEQSIELVVEAQKNNDVVVIEGIELDSRNTYTEQLNLDLAATFQSGLIFAGNAGMNTLCEISDYLNFYMKRFATYNNWLCGYIANKMMVHKNSDQDLICQEKINQRINCLGQVSEEKDLVFLDDVVDHISQNLMLDSVIEQLAKVEEKPITTPAFFKYTLIDKAQKANKRIVLPEGEEPRTLRAALICHERRIASCVLLGSIDKIRAVAKQEELELPENIEIIEPDSIAKNYVDKLVELRQHRGMTKEKAQEELKNSVVLGTMMLANNDVDGLVSGVVHTTADTIRPAFQILGTAKGSKIVSSVFFMLMPEGANVYGDCAVNPNPTPEQLADIAIQSAESAKAFDIEPRVAMISYSTGTSGAGPDVEAVTEATKLAKKKNPSLLLDGPIQFDAAFTPSVGKQKLPDSKVAGQATVYIFPDLNTGNTTYKAVQRSANIVSIGPVLQGLARPVNDLSRGALVEDIVYTIAITAVQAANNG